MGWKNIYPPAFIYRFKSVAERILEVGFIHNMKTKLFVILLPLILASGCSPRPILEGPVKFIIYEPSPGDVRDVHAEKAPPDFQADSKNQYGDLWDCAPYVRLYPDYVELVYHFNTTDRKVNVFTHVFPTARLHFLRWIDKKP